MSATITFRMLLFRNRSTTTSITSSITSSSRTVCRKFSSPAVAQAMSSTMSMSSTSPSSSSSMPSSSSLKLPTRHSWKKPPPICHDWMELQEMTTAILQQPIGSLYSYDSQQQSESDSNTNTNNNTNNNRLIWAAQERWKSYEIADPTIQQVEYLIRGHASKIPGSLYYSTNTGNTAAGTTATGADDEQEHNENHHLESMQQLLKRMQQEGMMYMQVRKEQQKLQRARNNSSSSDSDSSDSDSDSSSSDSSDEEENDNNNKNNKTTALEDFAPPGATIAMYDAILDAMAVSLSAPADGKNNNNNITTNIDPLDFLHWSLQALTMEEQDAELVLLFSSNTTTTTTSTNSRRRRLRHASDQYSMATHVTYNAALRGIAQGIIKNSQQQQQQQEYCDNALYAAFQLYNHLTHSNHLPRNTASIIYMCQIVHHALLPASRVKGNISVTFWKQACQLGLASTELANTILQMHTTDDSSSSSSSCGPEFDVFLKQLKTPLDQLPQRYRRSVKKNQHSKHY
eukprot:scaffold775_cov42-Cylindrotheca_fusiformis.AAC.1